MSEDIQRKSARIIQFPVGGRAALSVRRDGVTSAVALMPARVANVACASSWYHEEAIRDADQSRRH